MRVGVLHLGALVAGLTVWGGCKRQPNPMEVETPVDRSSGVLPEIHVPRVLTGSIHIDGRFNEPAWSKAGVSGGFVNPIDGKPAPGSGVNGSVRLLWDDTNLYLAFAVRDSDPTTPFSPKDVDPHLWERASGVEAMLQPGDFGDNQDYFELQFDTAGSVWDTQFDNYNRPQEHLPDGTVRFGHQEWDSQAKRAAVIERGRAMYTVEVALPWEAFKPSRAPGAPRPGNVWRANFYSFREGQRDALAWSPTLGLGNFHIASRFGKLIFDP